MVDKDLYLLRFPGDNNNDDDEGFGQGDPPPKK